MGRHINLRLIHLHGGDNLQGGGAQHIDTRAGIRLQHDRHWFKRSNICLKTAISADIDGHNSGGFDVRQKYQLLSNWNWNFFSVFFLRKFSNELCLQRCNCHVPIFMVSVNYLIENNKLWSSWKTSSSSMFNIFRSKIGQLMSDCLPNKTNNRDQDMVVATSTSGSAKRVVSRADMYI